MNHISVLGIDLAKNVFQLHGSNEAGEIVLKKCYRSRHAFTRFIAKLPPCLIGMEACGSAHYWARCFQGFGHRVKLMHAKYVKAFVGRNKHDAADAKACCLAVRQAELKAVPVKSVEQQAILMLHKHRGRLMKQRTQLSNQIRGFLYELGIVIPKGKAALKRELADLLSEADSVLPEMLRVSLQDMQDEHTALEKRISQRDRQIEQIANTHEDCQRLMKLPGVGPIVSLAFVAAVKGYHFEAGRQAAAWIGLTPKEHSSGGSRRLFGISKQGNRYLRCVLIHGARSIVRSADKKDDRLSLWIQRIRAEKGFNKAVVALANKTARRAWSMMQGQTNYQPDFADEYEIAAA